MKCHQSFVFFITSLLFSSSQASITQSFDLIKKDPNALYAFFKKMPKGGELHYHLAGGPYPETMLTLAASGDYCLETTHFVMTKNASTCDGVHAKDLFDQPALYHQTIKNWSMKDFVPGEESGHDHFFNGFIKYMSIVFNFRPQLLADVIERAADQQEHYLEVMVIPDNAESAQFGRLIKEENSYEKKRALLLKDNAFRKNIDNTIAESQAIINKTRTILNCEATPHSAQCAIKVNLIYYVLREQPIDNLFAQAVNAFESVTHSRGALIGVNLVQPEDGIISLRDYRKHMAIFNYLHQNYPQVHITLHAGELAPETVPPKELRYHIHEALQVGQAERIGHGVDISYEDHSDETLHHMAKHHIPVEINLISNQKILNISGKKHPLNDYLAHHVPVVLSTDDEGVLRTDLTRQYVEAVIEHGLNYPVIKQINRNALTYAFISGKSLWSNPDKSEPVPECMDLDSRSCHQFIKRNEKASLQWHLEQKLIEFEKKF